MVERAAVELSNEKVVCLDESAELANSPVRARGWPLDGDVPTRGQIGLNALLSCQSCANIM